MCENKSAVGINTTLHHINRLFCTLLRSEKQSKWFLSLLPELKTTLDLKRRHWQPQKGQYTVPFRPSVQSRITETCELNTCRCISRVTRSHEHFVKCVTKRAKFELFFLFFVHNCPSLECAQSPRSNKLRHI